MAKLSAPTRHALDIVAHNLIVHGIEQKVMKAHGAPGFYDYWLKQQTAGDRAIIREFEKMSREAYAEMARLMKEEAKP